MDAYGRVVRVFITKGTTADCRLGVQLIEGLDIIGLLADRGYDTNMIIEFARALGIEICIPPKKNRKEQREYDREVYKHRHIVENVFRVLKEWRGIDAHAMRRIQVHFWQLCILGVCIAI